MSDSLEVLEGRVSELPLARQAELFGDAIEHAGQQVESMAADISRLEEWQSSVGLLDKFWEGDERHEVVDALHQLKSFGNEIEATKDREQLTHVTAISSGMKSKLGTVLRDGGKAWGRRIDHDLGPLGSLGTLLEQFSDTRELGLRMVALARTAFTLKNSFPPKAQSIEQHKVMLKDAEEIRKNLAAIGTGESVQKFLAALANESATLDLVDETVFQWIRNRHAENRFRLKLKTGVSD